MQSSNIENEPEFMAQDNPSPISSRSPTPPPQPPQPLTWGDDVDAKTKRHSRRTAWTKKPNTSGWTDAKVFCCSPQAADANLGPPTFTGPQVAQRRAMVLQQLRALRGQEQNLEDDLAEVHSQIRDYEAARANLKDLEVLAAGLPRP
ncbi:hypothetical protein V5O48_017612 [Marasmius crinis-equi]|uniref:Uncharacterized protein n=1 Tax=Marasmius crinis-equi TaxID=585013 RepID=A0ABR3ENG5_9AGAR